MVTYSNHRSGSSRASKMRSIAAAGAILATTGGVQSAEPSADKASSDPERTRKVPGRTIPGGDIYRFSGGASASWSADARLPSADTSIPSATVVAAVESRPADPPLSPFKRGCAWASAVLNAPFGLIVAPQILTGRVPATPATYVPWFVNDGLLAFASSATNDKAAAMLGLMYGINTALCMVCSLARTAYDTIRRKHSNNATQNDAQDVVAERKFLGLNGFDWKCIGVAAVGWVLFLLARKGAQVYPDAAEHLNGASIMLSASVNLVANMPLMRQLESPPLRLPTELPSRRSCHLKLFPWYCGLLGAGAAFAGLDSYVWYKSVPYGLYILGNALLLRSVYRSIYNEYGHLGSMKEILFSERTAERR